MLNLKHWLMLTLKHEIKDFHLLFVAGYWFFVLLIFKIKMSAQIAACV